MIKKLKKEDVALHKESTAEGYLGVDIKQDGNHIMLQQRGLTSRIIETLGLNSKYSTPVDTPTDGRVSGGNNVIFSNGPNSTSECSKLLY